MLGSESRFRVFVKYGIEGVLKIKNFGIPIFLDLKLHDIPNTVKNTTENILKIQPTC